MSTKDNIENWSYHPRHGGGYGVYVDMGHGPILIAHYPKKADAKAHAEKAMADNEARIAYEAAIAK